MLTSMSQPAGDGERHAGLRCVVVDHVGPLLPKTSPSFVADIHFVGQQRG